MPNYAVHNGSVIANVIVADSKETAEKITGMSALETTGEPWTGWVFVDNEWVPPATPNTTVTDS